MFLHILIVVGTLNAAQSATFRIYKGSIDNYFETPLDNPEPLLDYIDKSINTTFCAEGVQNSATGPVVTTLGTAYLSLKNTNFILINWEKESSMLPNVLGYVPAMIAAREVGFDAGLGIVKLIEKGVDPNKVRLVGHSVGAHLMGYVGERTQQSGYSLLSIWGLDVAGPLYEKPIGVQGLNPSQAQYVNTILTNPGGLGTDQPAGSINFWVNCGNDGLQPGCPAGIYPPLSQNGTCSHDRSWMIMSEAVLNPSAFPGVLATSCSAWKSQDYSTTVINYIGDYFDPSKRGDFYLSTNAQSPFSKGNGGITPN